MRYESKPLDPIANIARAQVTRDGQHVYLCYGRTDDQALSRADSLAACCNTSTRGDMTAALTCVSALIDECRPDEARFLVAEIKRTYETALAPVQKAA